MISAPLTIYREAVAAACAEYRKAEARARHHRESAIEDALWAYHKASGRAMSTAAGTGKI